MKLGEIKLEALMMISPSDELRCDSENDAELRERIFQLKENSNYSDYLASMPGAINRCFSSLESKGVVPSKSYDLDIAKAKTRGSRLMFDLSEIEDLGRIDRIAFYSDYGEIECCDYSHEGDSRILLENKHGVYVVVYTPVIPRITQITDDAKKIALPEDVAELIPYFVKSEILRIENEAEAAASRNVYEGMTEELQCKYQGYQGAVSTVYRVM